MGSNLGVPGAGSTPEFMMAAVAGLHAVFDYRTQPMTSVLEWIQGHAPVTLVGMSLGAHLSAQHAHRIPSVNGLVLIAPAWTDAPDPNYAKHIEGLRDVGIRQHLASLPEEPSWVRNAVSRAWIQYPDEILLTHLLEAATTPGPGLPALQSIGVPTVIVGFWDDPFHPWDVAKQWATAVPRSRLIGMPRSSAGRNLGNIGHAAVVNLQELRRRRFWDGGAGRR